MEAVQTEVPMPASKTRKYQQAGTINFTIEDGVPIPASTRPVKGASPYGLHLLKPGQSIEYTPGSFPDISLSPARIRKRVGPYTSSYSKRAWAKKRKYVTRNTTKGIRVWRIK